MKRTVLGLGRVNFARHNLKASYCHCVLPCRLQDRASRVLCRYVFLCWTKFVMPSSNTSLFVANNIKAIYFFNRLHTDVRPAIKHNIEPSSQLQYKIIIIIYKIQGILFYK
jgi:hypothetical protein